MAENTLEILFRTSKLLLRPAYQANLNDLFGAIILAKAILTYTEISKRKTNIGIAQSKNCNAKAYMSLTLAFQRIELIYMWFPFLEAANQVCRIPRVQKFLSRWMTTHIPKTYVIIVVFEPPKQGKIV